MGQLQERYQNYREPQKFMEAGVYPFFREITGKQGTEVVMGGHDVLMFGSNAYTGLTGDQRIIDAAKAATDKYGTGCAGSRFLNGGTWVFRTIVCYFYIANEGISLLENCAGLGLPVPESIQNALVQLKDGEKKELKGE